MLDVSTFVDLDEAVIAFVHDLSVWMILGGTTHMIRWIDPESIFNSLMAFVED